MQVVGYLVNQDTILCINCVDHSTPGIIPIFDTDEADYLPICFYCSETIEQTCLHWCDKHQSYECDCKCDCGQKVI